MKGLSLVEALSSMRSSSLLVSKELASQTASRSMQTASKQSAGKVCGNAENGFAIRIKRGRLIIHSTGP